MIKENTFSTRNTRTTMIAVLMITALCSFSKANQVHRRDDHFATKSNPATQAAPTDLQDKSYQEKIYALTQACLDSPQRDLVCDKLIAIKEIGDDNIEIIKNFAALSPAQYQMLTLFNIIISGRFRYKTDSFMFKKSFHIYDFKKDESKFTIETSF